MRAIPWPKAKQGPIGLVSRPKHATCARHGSALALRVLLRSDRAPAAQRRRKVIMARKRKNEAPKKRISKRILRARYWFDHPDDPEATALYFERYLNFGFTRAEITSGRPIIGIAQSGSDLSPCNRHHLQLAERVRDGIRDAGGIAIEFPVHPIQE